MEAGVESKVLELQELSVEAEGHCLLRDVLLSLGKGELAETISNDGIDRLYDLARESGALGGKVVGAGGGGILLLYCRRESQDRLREAFDGYCEPPFGLERDGSKVIFNALRYSTK
jgi:D-glycero-alpha-D-manno-heptose-7-phosphate kinase